MSTATTASWLASRTRPAIHRKGEHRVTAILVAHDGEVWLPRALDGLARLSRQPDQVIAVDSGSRDRSVELLRRSPHVSEVVVADREIGFGEAVGLGLARAGRVVDVTDVDVTSAATVDIRTGNPGGVRTPEQQRGVEPGATVEWLWLLHDDVEVSPDCLTRMLSAADAHKDASVIGPKVKGWNDRGLVVECGVSIAGSGRRDVGVTRGERDQGQLDGRLDVLGVGSAGMLVRRELWERLGGFDAELPMFRDDLEFCWRARRSGERVIVVPGAEIHHAEAAFRGHRSIEAAPDEALSADRRAAAMVMLAHAPKRRVVLKGLRLLLGSLIRGIFLTLVKVSDGAWDDLRAVIGALSSRRAVASMRARVRQAGDVGDGAARQLRPSRGATATHWRDDLAQILGAKSRGNSSGAASREDARQALRSRIRNARIFALAVVMPVLIVCLVATAGLWFGPGRLLGGALLPAPDSVADLWSSFSSAWHDVGLGSAVPSAPYLLLLAAGAIPLAGSATMAVQVMLLLGPVFAAVTSYLSLRGLVRGIPRLVAALAYALLPATIAAVGTGQLGTIAVAILLPPAVRMIARVSTLSGSTLRSANWSTAGGAALLMVFMFAFAPPVSLLIAGFGLGVALVRRTRTGVARMLVVLLAPLAVLWPWSAYVVTNPTLLLFEVGAVSPALTDPGPSPLELLALNPGGPAAPPALLGAVLAVLAVLALRRRRTRARVATAWLFFVGALALATAQSVLLVPVPWSQLHQSAWPGATTVVMGAALIFAAAVGAPLSWSRRRITVLAVGLLTPALLAAWWGMSGGQIMERGDPSGVSPFIAAEMVGPNAPRTMV
ncbi:MAG: glycosyltransferase, partial [Candidatus Nanopelagicales bacterium]|nr:glycosyltransferase [Candidatus Nanopelagicales bacterium]